MDGHQYEYYCAKLLRKRGFSKVTVTRGSGDQGVDIVASRKGKRYGIQCKYYTHPVGNKAVQEVFAGAKYYDCEKSIVLTNNTFTKSARELEERTGVELWEYNRIPYHMKGSGLAGWLGLLACLLGIAELWLREGSAPAAGFGEGWLQIQEPELFLLIAGGLCNVASFHKWGIALCGCLCYLAAGLAGLFLGETPGRLRLSGLVFYGILILISGVKAWRLRGRAVK